MFGAYFGSARLFDANLDGKLGVGDIALFGAGAQQVSVPLGKREADQVRIALSVANAAERFAAHQPRFPTGAMEAPRELWRSLETTLPDGSKATTGFVTQPGVKPSDAVEDLFRRPDQYAVECATANSFVFAKALLDLVGPERFDALFPQMALGIGWGSLTPLMELAGSNAELDPAFVLRPGEHGYVKNPGWTGEEADDVAWQGENVIAATGGRLQGHNLGLRSLGDIIAGLNEHRGKDATQSAFLSTEVARFYPDLFDRLSRL